MDSTDPVSPSVPLSFFLGEEAMGGEFSIGGGKGFGGSEGGKTERTTFLCLAEQELNIPSATEARHRPYGLYEAVNIYVYQ